MLCSHCGSEPHRKNGSYHGVQRYFCTSCRRYFTDKPPRFSKAVKAQALDMYAAIDLLSDKLDRLLREHRSKVVDHHRGESAARSNNFG